MTFMHLLGFDPAALCATRLYNAGLFFFGYPPHKLTLDQYRVFVMSQLWVGDKPDHQPPPNGPAFIRVMEATAKEYKGVTVRLANSGDWNMGYPITQEIPITQKGGGITKYLWGNKAGECSGILFDSGLIGGTDQTNGVYKITSRVQLRANNPDQSGDFDHVVKAAAKDFGDVNVSDNPP
jgi:hypothetical protein